MSAACQAVWDLVFKPVPSEWLHGAAAARLAPECEGNCELDAAIKLIASCAGITRAGGLFGA